MVRAMPDCQTRAPISSTRRETSMAFRFCVSALVVAAASVWAAPAIAQGAYPDRPVTVVVPQGAGGANDTIARIVLQKMSTLLGQSMVVDNRPGAGGTIGTAFAAKARPDGYTLMLTADSAQVINPALYKNPGFDPV